MNQTPGRDMDLTELPLEGVAAYWLSLKKLVGSKKSFKDLEKEAEYTNEPYIGYLLDTVFGELGEERVRHLAGLRQQVLLADLGRKMDLMRLAVMDIAANENPRKTLAKMTAKYDVPPLNEEKAMAMLQELTKTASNRKSAAANARLFNAHHRLKDEQLMVMLLFYVNWSRREGKIGCEPFLEFIGSEFFADGLAMVVDGFDTPFVRKRLRVHRDSILRSTAMKMEMSLEMCLGIRNRYSYDDLFRVAKAFMT